MPNTVPMTQRAEFATVRDRLAVDDLVTAYAVAVDDGDWPAYRDLFTPDGRADYRSAGGIEGDARRVAAWLAENLARFAVRQHLIVNRQVRFGVLEHDTGDTARVRAGLPQPDAPQRHRGAAPPRTWSAAAGTTSGPCAHPTAGA